MAVATLPVSAERKPRLFITPPLYRNTSVIPPFEVVAPTTWPLSLIPYASPSVVPSVVKTPLEYTYPSLCDTIRFMKMELRSRAIDKLYRRCDRIEMPEFQRGEVYATGVTPAMDTRAVGVGSQYMAALVDSKGEPFDGGRTYKLHLPPNIPVKDFWSVILYDGQTRSMLQNNQDWPAVSSQTKGLQPNPDGSVDVYFGPAAPAGKENNWIQTIPGKGRNTLLRLYGPLQPWFDKTWRPGEIEPLS